MSTSVSASATTANAAAPGQLKESSARSFTALAIIFTLPPPSSSGVGNAESVQAKTTSEPDTMPGIDSGSVTRRKTRAGVAPRLAAARSSAGSTWLIAAARSRIIVGIEKCTRPIEHAALREEQRDRPRDDRIAQHQDPRVRPHDGAR